MAVAKTKRERPGARKSGSILRKPKSSKPPTLKQKYARQNKIIRADDVQWKSVDIPDTLGDYSGLFGLEELDGVDVRMVNGKPEFIARDSDEGEDVGNDNDDDNEGPEKASPELLKPEKSSGPKASKFTNQSSSQSGISSVPGSGSKSESNSTSESSEDDEFTGFDDSDSDVSIANESEHDTSIKEDNSNVLHANSFAALHVPLPDHNDINMPLWDGLGLSAYVLSGLQSNKFFNPTPIQKKTLPLAFEGKDVIGKATTGSGKTLAYGLPILEKYIERASREQESGIAEENKNGSESAVSVTHSVQPPCGIVFAPTRELAHQVVQHMNEISKYCPLPPNGIVSITGGLSIQRQERLLSYGPGVIVATPGRFLELIEKDELLTKRMAATDIVVLDEADRLLQDGHFEEFERILNLLEKHRSRKLHGWRWQTLVFSATFSREFFGKLDRRSKKTPSTQQGLIGNDEILELLKKKLKFKDSKPALCDANPKEIVSGQVTEALVECGATERDLYIYYFVLAYPGSTLVFANSVESVRRLVPLLEYLGIPAFSIHSSMMQKQRLRALERFKSACGKNTSAVLVATDVAARGLDIPNIDHVAHYHLPRSADVYVHRSGRTARAGKEGVSVMFCSPQEASGPLKKLRRLVAASAEKSKLNMRSDVKLLPIEHDIITQIRERVQLAAKLADSSIASTATRKEGSWIQQAAEDLGIDNLSDLDEFEDDVIKKQRKRKERKQLSKAEQNELRYTLKNLLAQPLRKNHRRSYITSGLENLAHQIVSGNTSEAILGKKSVKALDELRGTKNRVTKNGKKDNGVKRRE